MSNKPFNLYEVQIEGFIAHIRKFHWRKNKFHWRKNENIEIL